MQAMPGAETPGVNAVKFREPSPCPRKRKPELIRDTHERRTKSVET
jgi:hypothetical protein